MSSKDILLTLEEEVWPQLTLLRKVNPGNKISLLWNKIFVGGLLDVVNRAFKYWYGKDRHCTVKELNHLSELCYKYYHEITATDHNQETTILKLSSFKKMLTGAISGINNLTKTYEDDEEIVDSLNENIGSMNILIRLIEDECERRGKILTRKFNPVKKKVDPKVNPPTKPRKNRKRAETKKSRAEPKKPQKIQEIQEISNNNSDKRVSAEMSKAKELSSLAKMLSRKKLSKPNPRKSLGPQRQPDQEEETNPITERFKTEIKEIKSNIARIDDSFSQMSLSVSASPHLNIRNSIIHNLAHTKADDSGSLFSAFSASPNSDKSIGFVTLDGGSWEIPDENADKELARGEDLDDLDGSDVEDIIDTFHKIKDLSEDFSDNIDNIDKEEIPEEDKEAIRKVFENRISM